MQATLGRLASVVIDKGKYMLNLLILLVLLTDLPTFKLMVMMSVKS